MVGLWKATLSRPVIQPDELYNSPPRLSVHTGPPDPCIDDAAGGSRFVRMWKIRIPGSFEVG